MRLTALVTWSVRCAAMMMALTKLRLWDTQSGELLQTVSGHTGRVEYLAYSADGKILATGGGGGYAT